MTRQIQLSFSATEPYGRTIPDYGESRLGGTYEETLTGLHRNPIKVAGIFLLQKVSGRGTLNQ